MKFAIRAAALLVPLLFPSRPALAQLGELQLGVAGSYGAAQVAGPGLGLAAGLAPGRLAYVGFRWVRYQGGGPPEVQTASQVFTADLALMVPVGPVDVMPGVAIGAARLRQRDALPLTSPPTVRTASELYVAASLAAELRLGRVGLIPEVQYALCGDPDFAEPVERGGVVVSLRLVLTLELRRIRW